MASPLEAACAPPPLKDAPVGFVPKDRLTCVLLSFVMRLLFASTISTVTDGPIVFPYVALVGC